MPAYENIQLTPKQARQWDETRTATQWVAPAFSHLMLSLLNKEGRDYMALATDKIPTAATDGRNILINPTWFFEMPLQERIFVLAHEILHCALNHIDMGYSLSKAGKVRYDDGTELPYDKNQMNIAQDLVINDILISSKIGSMPKGGMHDPSIVTAADSFLDAYRKIYKSGGGNGGSGGGGFDDHLDPGESQGKTPDKAMSERDERKIKAEIAAANNAAKQMGKMPAALGRVFEEIVTPKVSWREHIQALLARSLGNGSYDWRRPNRRMMMYDHFSPSPSAHGSECVVVACDTSGSIQTSEINMFLSEVGSILEEVRPRSLYIVWCDAAIGRIDECDDPTDLYAVKRAGCPGGGGTDFKPVFEWVSDQGLQPDAVVYLTDGFGSFPSHEPNYPVIWGSTYKDSTYPFGEVVMLPSGSN